MAESLPTACLEPLREAPGTKRGGDAAPGGWSPVAGRATRRLFKRYALVVLIVTLALVWLSRWALLLPPLSLPVIWWACQRTISARFYWATDDALWWRSGWPGRQLVIVPFDKIQSVELAQTPFDRRRDMARVTVDTAGSGAWHAASIAYLDTAVARSLAERLASEAGGREFLWS